MPSSAEVAAPGAPIGVLLVIGFGVYVVGRQPFAAT